MAVLGGHGRRGKEWLGLARWAWQAWLCQGFAWLAWLAMPGMAGPAWLGQTVPGVARRVKARQAGQRLDGAAGLGLAGTAGLVSAWSAWSGGAGEASMA